MMDGWIETLHFDEAWLPHAAFHPSTAPTTPWAKQPRAPDADGVQPRSRPQAAGRHQPGQPRAGAGTRNTKLDRNLFNESPDAHQHQPQYSIIACDVAAAMMEPPGGTALVEERSRGAGFRRAMRKVDEEFGADDWWFQVWGSGRTGRRGRRRGDWLKRTDSEGVQPDGEEAGTASATWRRASTCSDPIGHHRDAWPEP